MNDDFEYTVKVTNLKWNFICEYKRKTKRHSFPDDSSVVIDFNDALTMNLKHLTSLNVIKNKDKFCSKNEEGVIFTLSEGKEKKPLT